MLCVCVCVCVCVFRRPCAPWRVGDTEFEELQKPSRARVRLPHCGPCAGRRAEATPLKTRPHPDPSTHTHAPCPSPPPLAGQAAGVSEATEPGSLTIGNPEREAHEYRREHRAMTDKSEIAQRATGRTLSKKNNCPRSTYKHRHVHSMDAGTSIRSGHPFNKEHMAVKPSEGACAPCSFSQKEQGAQARRSSRSSS